MIYIDAIPAGTMLMIALEFNNAGAALCSDMEYGKGDAAVSLCLPKLTLCFIEKKLTYLSRIIINRIIIIWFHLSRRSK